MTTQTKQVGIRKIEFPTSFDTVIDAIKYPPVLMGMIWAVLGFLLSVFAGAPGLTSISNFNELFPWWVPNFLYMWVPGFLITGGYFFANVAWTCIWGMCVMSDNKSLTTWIMVPIWLIVTFLIGTPIWIIVVLAIVKLILAIAADQLDELVTAILPNVALMNLIAFGAWCVAFLPWRWI